uniref:Peptide-N(4)-(N-acetyl-beta-glucosaminyl)asparagine amidase n=1 Tax=Panagrolaimus sp. JU765 TaxID=591449 RepID=A0AC34PVI8_9BILA
EEKNEGDAQRVEVYFCQKCKKEVRFPRFNNPIKLLETRNGRCGEWANCFALFCRSVDLETRFVIDNADHVWVEIYSNEKKRWIHCDPCENVMDVPLMYEKGWKKELAYVFAFAKDHVMDVTWRYTFDRQKTTKRRKQVRPIVLINFFNKLNARLQKNLSSERKKVLEERFLAEIVEFILPQNNLRKKSEENQGRNSGSLDWKVERGEAGIDSCVGDSLVPIMITPSQNEIDSKCFEIIYDASKDEYSRTNDTNLSTKKWESQIYEVENIFRKIENDWKKAYLARKQGKEKGFLVWKINLKDLKIKQIEICVNSFKVENGNVFGIVCCGSQCQRLKPNGIIKLDDIKEADYLELRLELSGGNGENSWQHSQLFRTDLNNSEPGLKIKVEFE